MPIAERKTFRLMVSDDGILEMTAQQEDGGKRATSDRLAEFVHEARELETKCRGDERPPTAGMGDWMAGTKQFLRKNLGEGYVVRFEDNTGLNLEAARLPPGPNQHMAAGLLLRIGHLLEFIKEMK